MGATRKLRRVKPRLGKVALKTGTTTRDQRRSVWRCRQRLSRPVQKSATSSTKKALGPAATVIEFARRIWTVGLAGRILPHSVSRFDTSTSRIVSNYVILQEV